MYSLLHCHFESALRALALIKPDRIQYLGEIYASRSYAKALPAERLTLLWNTVLSLASEGDIFSEEVFRRIVRGFLDEMKASHVEHVDLRIGVSIGRWRWMSSAADGLTIFREEQAQYPSVSVSFLAGIDMTKPVSRLDAMFDTVLEDHDVVARIRGVDINFLPGDLPKFYRYLGRILDLQRSGLKINVHLGELFDNSISQEILSHLIPDRIGHGVLLLRDPTLVAIVKSHDICLDMCPTSNTTLGVVDWAKVSPARRALDLGIPVSINTDDPVLFNTNMNQEIQRAGLTGREWDEVVNHSRKYRYGNF